MPLNEFLPRYDVYELHSLTVSAPPERVLAAARDLTWRDVPLFAGLMAARSLPALLGGKRVSAGGRIVDDFQRGGFVELAQRPDELVFGAVGRFWRAAGGLRPMAPGDFAAFAQPGYAKTAFNFRVEAEPGSGPPRTRLSTETRVLATDPWARRRFLLYWRAIHPGSALIRRVWLRAIGRRAARAA